VVGGVGKATPSTDYAAITSGQDEKPVRVDASRGGSVPNSSATARTFNKDAFVQSARFGGC
jgi:hypothetical protein